MTSMRFRGFVGAAVALAAVVGLLMRAPAPAAQAPEIVTAWGEPDLQGIWTDIYATPLQRPERFAGQEVFTDEERAALDEQRTVHPRRDARGAGRHGPRRGGRLQRGVPVDPADRAADLVESWTRRTAASRR